MIACGFLHGKAIQYLIIHTFISYQLSLSLSPTNFQHFVVYKTPALVGAVSAYTDCKLEYIDDKPELIDLLLPKVQEYFSEYEKKTRDEIKEDAFTLYQIMADPKKYNVLSELRNGLISKDKLPKLVSKKSLDSLMENIEFLKIFDVIEELNYNSETYIVLKTNLQITTAFPEWMRKLLPKESEPVVVDKYKANENENKKPTKHKKSRNSKKK